ncbi:MAG: DegT/DnrJ/EryC1/StrS family aminotransferase [Candidatus Omnitrophota bacterium]
MSELALFGGERIRKKPFAAGACIGDEERQRVSQVLEEGVLSGFIAKKGDYFLGGKQVREFEGLVKDYFPCKHAVSVNSATAGLHVALGACGIGPGDEVIVPPYTMSATATAVLMQGAIPVFADIEEERCCLDPQKIEERVTSRTRAIIVVHLFGYPAKMDDIMVVAKRHGLKVVEDCAQAPGTEFKGKRVGTFGDAGVFSLNQHKTVTSGEGGFVITGDDRLALRMQLMRNHGEVIVDDFGIPEHYDIVGYNYRMTELEAAVATGQFRRLDSLTRHRIDLAEYLMKKLSGFKGLMLPKADGNKHVYFVFPMRFLEKEAGMSREDFVRALVAEGIPVAAGYVKPIYLASYYQKGFVKGQPVRDFYGKGICPVCERMHEKEFLCTGVCRHPHTKEDMDDVVAAVGKVFANRHEFKTS